MSALIFEGKRELRGIRKEVSSSCLTIAVQQQQPHSVAAFVAAHALHAAYTVFDTINIFVSWMQAGAPTERTVIIFVLLFAVGAVAQTLVHYPGMPLYAVCARNIHTIGVQDAYTSPSPSA